MTRNFVLAFLLLTFVSVEGAAATLFGRVIEVNDGDVITVFNLNRPVRIKLLAVDAPEKDQAFGEVAKKHLSELVYDKSVSVEYSGIASDGSLVGRVTLNGADIGAQMVRDGAAWFDASNQDRLSATDREIYQQSEQAARSEKRGLWQAENPVAPWEFVRAQMLKQKPAASLNAVTLARKPQRPPSELTNLTLMTARMNSAAASSSPNIPVDTDMSWATDSSPKEWRLFKPAGENFSAEMPAGGKYEKAPLGEDGTVDLNAYMVRDGSSIYIALWIDAPSAGESDREVLDEALRGFLRGLSHGSSYTCELEGERKFSVAGYAGSEFDAPSCTVPGKLRVFTKLTNGQRRIYIGAAFHSHEDPNIARFFKSFTVGVAATPRTRHSGN